MTITLDGTTGITLPGAGTGVQAGSLTLATAQTASGTSVDFTGIPSWVKRITVSVYGLSTNGTSSAIIRVGGAANGILSSGYFSMLVFPTAAWTSAVSSNTTGLFICSSAATMLTYGSATLTKVANNKWGWSGNFARDDTTDTMCIVSGGIELAEPLTTIRYTTFSGTDIFDAGTINIMYE